MNAEKATVSAFVISNAPMPPNRGVLDPILVVIRDFAPGRGQLTVECYGSAWSCWWGAMGDGKTVLEFLRGCDAEYVANCLIRPRRQWITSKREERREMEYLTTICAALISHAGWAGEAA